jgi:hypothetical protein
MTTLRTRRVLRLLIATAALALILLLGDAQPAAADNCSGLSDCYFVSKSAVTVTVGIGTVAVVLLLTPPVGGSPDVKPLDPKDVPLKPAPGAKGPPDQVKVAEPNGTVVDRPVKPPRPAGEEAAIRTKVREAERAVVNLPRPRQKLIFEEEALAAGRDQEFKALAAALRRSAPPEEWVRVLNPPGDRANTVAAVNAVDAALDKVPRIPKPGGAALAADALAGAHDSIVTQVSDLHDIGGFLAKAGSGARGVVTVQTHLPASWANAAPVDVGHAFNAGNVDGRIVFLDPQTGTVAATPHEVLAATGHDLATITSVRFIPTHPRFA